LNGGCKLVKKGWQGGWEVKVFGSWSGLRWEGDGPRLVG
jgi:hypothetical protein